MKNTATLEIPELMQFLRQELSELPDPRKPGNNTKYKVEDAVMGAWIRIFYPVTFFFRTSTFDEK
jgi:hypothetical protein